MKGNLDYHQASYWFELNLKSAMGTFASWMGVSNMATLLSFLDIPNVRLNGRFFIWKQLLVNTKEKLQFESMEQATDLEVKMTLDNEINF